MKCRILRSIDTAIVCTVLLITSACCPEMPATPDARQGFQKGLNYTAWAREQLSTPESDHSLKNLAATGANWVAIVVFGYQQTYTSTIITRDLSRTPSDEELVHAIVTAHSLGLQVMLKPHVDLRHDRDHWRGDIGEAFTDEAQWRTWFESYSAFIDHYARLARAHGVEQFCVGTELVGTTHREADWRKVVAGVREHFAGPITYAGNHGTEDVGIAWWDAVDMIGIDAYYVLTDKTDPTLDELKAAWTEKGYVETMASLAEKYDRPILLTEIGYRSADGTIKTPWDWDDLPLDLEEQAHAYEAALAVLWDRPWLAGIYWWNWDVNPQKSGPEDKGYSPHGKPAEDVLRAYYGGEPETIVAPTPYSEHTVERVHLPAPSPASAHPGWTSYTATGHVNDLAFDHDGGLWIATPGGLVRWNKASSEITRYTEADGLADNWVETLAVAPNGALWIATGGGISRFDGHIWITYDKDNGLPCNGVTDIAFAPGGDVWISTYGCGVARFDGSTWTVYTEEEGLLERHALCITVTSDGAVWFGTWKGVARFDGTEWTSYTTRSGLVSHGVEAITEDPDGGVWFGTWAGIGRLSSTLWTSYDTGSVGTWIESIAVAPDGATWAGTREGIACFDKDAWVWRTVLSIGGQPEERGTSITFAPDGSLWVGTYNSGIYHFNGKAWTNYSLDSGLPGNKVIAIATAPDGMLRAAIRPDRYDQGGGTWQYDGHTWTQVAPEDSLTSSDAPSTITAPDGTAWSILDRGVSRCDGQRWITYTIENGLVDDHVNAIAIDADGAAWIATNGGLSRYTPPE
ncbi:MAG: hypothetical protein JXA14_20390 [Anaerolineae bacterium]|nr:hypothetical protein [Anaerolineae bacterium]